MLIILLRSSWYFFINAQFFLSFSFFQICSLMCFFSVKLNCPLVLPYFSLYESGCHVFGLCSHIVSIMSVSRNGDNSEGQIQLLLILYDWDSSQTCRVYYAPVVACQFINLFFHFKRKFCKKGVIEVIDMLCNMKVKCDFFLQKKFFFLDTRTLPVGIQWVIE